MLREKARRGRQAMTRAGRAETAATCAAAAPDTQNRSPQPLNTGTAPARPSRSDADPELDVAMYTCTCGLVFEAPVSTSVGCPHCGDQQAW